MLVDHANPVCDRIRGRTPPAFFPPDKDLAPIRLIHSVEQVHGGGFTGAILPDDAMDRPGLDAEIHRGIRQDRTELLGESAQLDGWRCDWCHRSGSLAKLAT